MKALLALIAVVLLAACNPSATGPAAPDMGPIGADLKVLGFCLIGVAVVITAGRNIR
ncbi:MAG: hypothetical protein ACRDBP_17545 [Luteolibacter sp.]